MKTTSASPFPATQWTSVVAACRTGSPDERQRALNLLCTSYWYPLYAFARRQGRTREDAEDLTQGLFRYLLERDLVASADPQLGKLRTFLLTIFQRYMTDVRAHEQALKRGGGQEVFSLDANEGERRYETEPADIESPEQLFDQSWAMSVIDRALHDLGASEQEAGKGQQFGVLQGFLNPTKVSDGNYETASAELGMNAEAVRKMVSRLRGKFRDCLREQIAATLRDPSDAQVDEELQALKTALRG